MSSITLHQDGAPLSRNSKEVVRITQYRPINTERRRFPYRIFDRAACTPCTVRWVTMSQNPVLGSKQRIQRWSGLGRSFAIYLCSKRYMQRSCTKKWYASVSRSRLSAESDYSLPIHQLYNMTFVLEINETLSDESPWEDNSTCLEEANLTIILGSKERSTEARTTSRQEQLPSSRALSVGCAGT